MKKCVATKCKTTKYRATKYKNVQCDKNYAVFFAIVSATSRKHYEEYLATVILPIVVLSFYRTFYTGKSHKKSSNAEFEFDNEWLGKLKSTTHHRQPKRQTK